MSPKPFKVDLNKPLVSQVGHLGKDYDKWVHTPIGIQETPRFFQSDFLEFFTRTKWYVVPIVWLPVICWLVSKSMNEYGISSTQAALTLIGGVFMWSFLEYTLHRFLFHMEANSYWGITLHYLIHGCHHKHPIDNLRLVFPPAATAILSIPVWTMIKTFSPPSFAHALFGGGLLGYVLYDLTHYYLHHGKTSKGYLHGLKRYHMNHHYKVQTAGFGITSAFWDIIFRTYPKSKNYGKPKSADQ